MKVTLIYNSAAGNGGQPDGPATAALIREFGHEVEVFSSKDPEWEVALDRESDVIAVGGGDGTVSKVARRLIHCQTPLTILPVGTANNISKTLGFTGNAIQDLVAGWTTAERLPCDMGVARGPWGSKWFIESLGMGLFARLMAEMHGRKDPEMAKLADTRAQTKYAQQLLKKRLASWPAQNFRVSLDGREIADHCILLEAMNINYVGPNLRLAPRANPGDGILDVVLVASADRELLAEHLDNFLEGKPISSHLTIFRGKELKIESTGIDVHIDDLPVPADATVPMVIDVGITEHAVNFLVPLCARPNRRPD